MGGRAHEKAYNKKLKRDAALEKQLSKDNSSRTALIACAVVVLAVLCGVVLATRKPASPQAPRPSHPTELTQPQDEPPDLSVERGGWREHMEREVQREKEVGMRLHAVARFT